MDNKQEVTTQNPDQAAKHPKFGARDKAGYMFGDFGNDFFFLTVAIFLTVFYTDVMGISGAAVGFLFLAARFVDAITDVCMGVIVDTAKPTKAGRFRPWIRRGALPLAIAGILVFFPISGVSHQTTFIYACVTYILYGCCYTMVNIPYGSMASVMTDDPTQRASLSTFRNVGASISSLLINLIVPIVCFTTVIATDGTELKQANGNRFFVTMIVFAMCAMVCYYFCYKLCTERLTNYSKKDKSKQGSNAFKTALKGIAKNKPFITLVIVALTSIFVQHLINSLNVYVFKDHFKMPALLAFVGILAPITTFVIAPFMVKIVRNFGKKEALTIAFLVASAFYLILGFLRTDNGYLYIAISFCAVFGIAFFNTVVWALVIDCIDYQELVIGERNDASVYAIYSFSRKLGQAFAGFLSGMVLSVTGYVSSTGAEVVVQSEKTVSAIYLGATIVPGVFFFLVALFFAFVYPLNKKALSELAEKLNEKKNNN
ncbi:MAG: glycoside-pentoside-hexuronide (GPH):cation symporter [Oscillospiraceae bacterium]|nr:glycoside-pentoside-hexuronide (GPH):cation symporter [Oscillospiraceae bacterium]